MPKALSSLPVRRGIALFFFVFALGSGLLALLSDHATDTDEVVLQRRVADIASHQTSVPGSCTVFMASSGDHVLFANNEDYTNYNTFYWTDASKDGHYGGLYFGFDDFFPQGGINEKGLMFDYTSLPPSTILPHPERPHREPEIYNLNHWSEPSKVMTIMRHAATVEEAIKIAKTYDWAGTLLWEVILADSSGDAVIISAGPDGDLAFTRKAPGDGFMVAGNVNPANPTNRYSPDPCPKITGTSERLSTYLAHGSAGVTVDHFRSMLDAVHAEGPNVNTVYSDILDPKAGKAYLYYWHQYGNVVELDVAAEIAKGTGPTSLRELFPASTIKVAKVRHFYHRNRRLIKATGLAAAMASLVCGIILVRKRKVYKSLPPEPLIALRT
jgi:hypothetical protein